MNFSAEIYTSNKTGTNNRNSDYILPAAMKSNKFVL